MPAQVGSRRMFNGREFWLHNWYYSDSDVRSWASVYKREGYYTRVVDDGEKYELWLRAHEEGHSGRRRQERK